MPRSEQPLEGDDALTAFAMDLRTLRQKAGSPPYRRLARTAHYSSTTLADAARGNRFPSLAVTLAYVQACGGDTGEWEKRWHEVAAALASERPSSDPAAEAALGDCPYAGLAAFEPEEAGRFFGRERLTDELVARVRLRRFTALFGASGSGKSSLLRAGLLPRVAADDAAAQRVDGDQGWPALLFAPGAHPLDECAVRLSALVGGSAAAIHRQLREDPRALHLIALQALVDCPAGTELLVVVDQFEEIFTLCAEREREQFVDLLLTAVGEPNSRVRVVIGVRADFYPRCTQIPDLVEALLDAQVLVGPMSTEELRRAISGPATAAGCAVEGALLARIVADAAGQPNALPLISHALRETWQHRRGNTLTVAGYEAAGGIHYALSRTAEATYQALTEEQRRIARGILLRLVALGQGTEDTKRRVPRDEFDESNAEAVLDALARARLIALDAGTVELTHEALLSAWPRLRRWIDEDRAGLLIRQQLIEAAAAWERERRDAGVLYRGERLTAATAWAENRHDLPLDERSRQFLAASIRNARRSARLRRSAVAALCVLALMASVAAVVAIRQGADARAARDRASFQQILAEADAVRPDDPSLAAQLDLAAYRLLPAPQAATTLLASQNLPLSARVIGHTEAVYAVAFSPNGRILATGSGDDTIRLWSISEFGHPTPLGAPLRGHSDWVYWLAFSPNGRTLASASRDHTVRLWDVTDPSHPQPAGGALRGHGSYVFSVSFSPDGRTLATASYDHTVRLWDVSDPARAHQIGEPLLGNTDSVASAAYSPDGRTVASAGHDHTVRLWNVTDPAHPKPWGPPLITSTETVYAVAFSPDSHLLASVGADRMVRLWNVADPANPTPAGTPLAGHSDVVLGVAFSHDGRRLATSAADHTVRLWDVSNPTNAAALGPPLLGHTGIVDWVAFSPDDRILVSASEDHTARLWNLPRTALTGHTDAVTALAPAADGRTLATASADHTITLWDLTGMATNPHILGPALTGGADTVTRLAFSSDGLLLASADADHTVRLWDTSAPAHPRLLCVLATADSGSGDALAFSPDGHLLATDGTGNTIRLWDLTDPAHPRPLVSLTGQISATTWAGFSPDGHLIAATSSDDKVRLWNLADSARPTVISTGDTDGLLWAAFRRDGNILAIAGAGHAVQLWDVHDPEHPGILGTPLTAHTSAVTWTGFSPDGRTLTSTSTDGTVRLWDVTNPAHATSAGSLTAGHVGAINAAAYTPDGKALATAGDDRTIQLTVLNIPSAAARICTTTTNILDADQWQQHVPELPFASPCA